MNANLHTENQLPRLDFNRSRSRRGAAFSILELLLVLVILAILSGIVGVKFAGQSAKAKVTAAKTQLSEYKTALGLYEINVGAYPTTQQGLEALVEQPSNLDDWTGPYLNADTEFKDQWGNDWQYRYPGTQNEEGFDLYSFGPDGKEGGDDDVANWNEEQR